MDSGSAGGYLNYRPDIDGLRALAVVPVVLFHAQVPGFSGGYVGVDVFFVISGYLITSIILRERRSGGFCFLSFYNRRARRILPALTAVVLATAVAGWFLLLPLEFGNTGASMASVGGFVSNVYFWRQSGYFAAPAHETPLLHTWSLSVEEQFYLVWPVFLIGLSRLRRVDMHTSLWACVLVGLALAEWTVRRKPTMAFYLSPFRAWELGLGGMLAAPRIQQEVWKRHARWLSLVGLVSLLWPIVAYSGTTRFPGIAALPACAGTAVLIACGNARRTVVSRLLSLTPLVAVGKISYSLYLWHWPILVVGMLHLGRPLTPLEICVAIGVSFCLAAASYRWVERPFRRHSTDRLAAVRGVVLGATATLAVAGLGLVIWQQDGFSGRLPLRARKADNAMRAFGSDGCLAHGAAIPSGQACYLGRKNAPLRGVLWGDSHADHFAPAISDAAAAANVSTRKFVRLACPPLVGATRVDWRGNRLPCTEFNNAVIERILANEELEVVVLAARWSLFSETRHENGNRVFLRDNLTKTPTQEDSRRVLASSLTHTVDLLRQRGLRVVILGQVPSAIPRSAACTVRALWWRRDPSLCDTTEEQAARELEFSRKLISRLAAQDEGVVALDSFDAICFNTVCRASIDGLPIYRDQHHLNRFGGRRIGSAWGRVLFTED